MPGFPGPPYLLSCVASFLQAASWEASLRKAGFSAHPRELGPLAVHPSKRVGSLGPTGSSLVTSQRSAPSLQLE